MKKNLPPEGSVFLVPLRDKGYAVGILARASGEGHCFGYFFGPRINDPAEVQVDEVAPEDAILVGKFGDLDLLRGKWKVVTALKNWDRQRWTIPPLARVDEVGGKAWLSTYDDNFDCVEEREIQPSMVAEFPYDRMMGSGSVEIRLTKILQQRSGK